MHKHLEIVSKVYRDLTPQNLGLGPDDRRNLDGINHATTMAIIGLLYLPDVTFYSQTIGGRQYGNIVAMLAFEEFHISGSEVGLHERIVESTNRLAQLRHREGLDEENITGMHHYQGTVYDKNRILKLPTVLEHRPIEIHRRTGSIAKMYDSIPEENKPTLPSGKPRNFYSILDVIENGNPAQEAILYAVNRNAVGGWILASAINTIKDHIID